MAFDGWNHGSQTGINYGQITNEFHLPPGNLHLCFIMNVFTHYYLDIGDKLPIVHEAIFDSWEDQHEEECLPGTRTDVLHQIREWAFSPQGPCIFWLNGMAGTGKTAIARTVAKLLSEPEVGLLGASFFLQKGRRRSRECNEAVSDNCKTIGEEAP